MKTDDLIKLNDLLEEFLEQVDDEGSVSVERALTNEGAVKRLDYIESQLEQVRFVIRWVKSKYTPTQSTPHQKG